MVPWCAAAITPIYRPVRWSNKLLALPGAVPVAALLLGALAVPAFAPIGWSMLAPLSLTGLLVLLDRETKGGFWLGWLYGLGFFGVGVSWVYVSLAVYGGMPVALSVLATFLFCAVVALFPAMAGWAVRKLSVPGWLRWLVVFPLLWVLSEWVRGWLLTGFPWLAIGYAQVPDGALAGYAPVIGVYGVSWLSALTAGGLLWLLRDVWLPGKWLAPMLFLCALLGGGEALKHMDWTRPAGEPFKVALLQGNISQDEKWRPEMTVDTLVRYAGMIGESEGARLVVLPESAFPLFFHSLPERFAEQLRLWAARRQADILFGIPTGRMDGDYYNSVASLGTSPTQFYSKHHLVPFGEFVPPGFGWTVDVLHIPLSDFARGDARQPPIEAAGQKIAVNICYEDAFGEEIIRALPQASLLVNVTNDAWFGDTFAAWQHAQMSQMRALETGRYMLRSTNTGVTAIIDPKGRFVSWQPEFTQGVLRGEVRGYTGSTPYVRWGNWPVAVLALSVLVWRVLNGWMVRRKTPA